MSRRQFVQAVCLVFVYPDLARCVNAQIDHPPTIQVEGAAEEEIPRFEEGGNGKGSAHVDNVGLMDSLRDDGLNFKAKLPSKMTIRMFSKMKRKPRMDETLNSNLVTSTDVVPSHLEPRYRTRKVFQDRTQIGKLVHRASDSGPNDEMMGHDGKMKDEDPVRGNEVHQELGLKSSREDQLRRKLSSLQKLLQKGIRDQANGVEAQQGEDVTHLHHKAQQGEDVHLHHEVHQELGLKSNREDQLRRKLSSLQKLLQKGIRDQANGVEAQQGEDVTHLHHQAQPRMTHNSKTRYLVRIVNIILIGILVLLIIIVFLLLLPLVLNENSSSCKSTCINFWETGVQLLMDRGNVSGNVEDPTPLQNLQLTLELIEIKIQSLLHSRVQEEKKNLQQTSSH